MATSAFWSYYYFFPFKFQDTKNLLLIFAFFYLPTALFFICLRLMANLSRFHSVSLGLIFITILPITYIFTTLVGYPNPDIAMEFLFFYSLSLPLASAGALTIFLAIPAFLRLIIRKPQYFLFSTLSPFLIAYVLTLEIRLYDLHKGYDKFGCSYYSVKRNNSEKIARIVGSYSEGSGFFISPNQVITNKHVVDGEEYPKIIMPSGSFITPITVELSNDYDIAVITIKEMYPDYVLNTIDPEIKELEDVISLGYPLGSDIKGYPTALTLKFESTRTMSEDETEYLQFSGSIVSGMSGGPVLDKCGELVGVNTISTSATSLIISNESLKKAIASEMTPAKKKELKPGATPKDSVYAYYYLLKARDTQGCYDLLSSNYKTKSTYEEWTARFPNVINVDVFIVEEIKPNLVYVMFGMAEWVDGEQDRKLYEGAWETIEDNGSHYLNKSHIVEVENINETRGPEYYKDPEAKK
jgi:hypothetical protein